MNIKPVMLFALCLFVQHTMSSQTNANTQDLTKVATIDSTLETLYGVISGEKGEARDWDLFKFLFHPDAKLIPTQTNTDGIVSATYMTPSGYVARAGDYLVENGFFEKEIHRVENTFGNITQVFSTYESYRSESDSQPFMRGINSIQLMHDGERYWVINIYWMQESPQHPISEQYLPKG